MLQDIYFDSGVLEVLVGGQPVLNLDGLRIESVEQARGFIKSYGFDLDDPATMELLWGYHKRAVLFAHRELFEPGDEIPAIVAEPGQLGDLTRLLILASTRDETGREVQRWACGLLKIIHALVHLDSDLFSRFSEPIQNQILAPFEQVVINDSVSGLSLGPHGHKDSIPLKKFERKAFKTPDSSLLKLLIKPETIAFRLLDKIGVRFVTRNVFDAFQVMRYLLLHNIISLPNTIPDQSNNTLYPLNLFMEFARENESLEDLTEERIDGMLKAKLARESERGMYNEKLNRFTNPNYKFMKFISRKLIRVQLQDQKPIHFFYPYEVQIVDYETYVVGQSGDASHGEYKRRQCRQARARVFGLGIPDSN